MFATFFLKIDRLTLHAIILIALAAFGQGCESDPGSSCYPGDQQACTCANGNAGLKLCAQSGSAYGACTCNDATGSSSSGTGGTGGTGGMGGTGGTGGMGGMGSGGSGGSGLLPFMAPCTDSLQCASMLCFAYTSGVSLCTKNCTNDADCPAPSPGCNNMGVCKKP